MKGSKSQIFLQYRCTLAELALGHPIYLGFGQGARAHLELRPLTENEAAKSVSPRDARCEITLTRAISSSKLAMLEEIEAGRMPVGSIDEHGEHPAVGADGRIREGFAPPFDLLPVALRETLRGFRREALQSARDAARLLRWRLNQLCPHNPVRNVSLPDRWSRDCIAWSPLPVSLRGGRWRALNRLNVSPGELFAIEEMFCCRQAEPLGHDLFLEAWQQRHSNPRSALVLGMAALEAGLKQCIGALAPDAAWLADNLQSPPIHRLFGEYIPELVRQSNSGKTAPVFPRVLIERLKEATTLRNSVAHRGVGTIPQDWLHNTLCLCRDLLWLLDYLTGHEWAAGHIRAETRQLLEISVKPPNAE